MAVLARGASLELDHERRASRRATATAIRTWRRTASSAPPARTAGSPIAVEDDAAWAPLRRARSAAPSSPTTRASRRSSARKRHEDELEALVDRVDRERDAGGRRRPPCRRRASPPFTAATNRDLAEDPHLAARGFFVDARAPRGRHAAAPRRARGACRRATAACAGRRRASARTPTHVLRDVCGYSADEIAALRAADVLA